MKLILFHQRITTLLKIISILGIISILLLFYSKFETKSLKLESSEEENSSKNTSITNYDQAQNYELTIQNSIFEGVNKDLRAYKIIADKAVKTSDYKYKLHYIEALYKLIDNDLLIYADRGSIDDKSKLLRLRDNVEIAYNNAILSGQAIQINLVSKSASSNTGVILRYNDSKITADSFVSLDDNNIVNFKGHVVAKIKISDF
jgi:lipopolysaccharide export system protein LptC